MPPCPVVTPSLQPELEGAPRTLGLSSSPRYGPDLDVVGGLPPALEQIRGPTMLVDVAGQLTRAALRKAADALQGSLRPRFQPTATASASRHGEPTQPPAVPCFSCLFLAGWLAALLCQLCSDPRPVIAFGSSAQSFPSPAWRPCHAPRPRFFLPAPPPLERAVVVEILRMHKVESESRLP